ncbi:hypothetical protein WN944_027414 [Citrus x changshan-huyou]|uniref:Uncharacterized protein n=1 Tax=Citrus x changshan-huyou TaxID=2935761 RepID=A0AAP0LJY3_9ROSI
MGKNEKTGLGRALVKHHNHMIQETKEKGIFYRKQHKKVLESVTDVNDIDAVIQQAEEAEAYPVPIPLINLWIRRRWWWMTDTKTSKGWLQKKKHYYAA